MAEQRKHIKLHTHGGSPVHDEAHSRDFAQAQSFKNKIFVGKLGLYHKDLFRRYFIPYDAIHRVYKQVEIITVDDSPPYEHYRIVVEGPEDPLTEILFGEGFMNRTADNDLADRLLHVLHEEHGLEVGYDEDRGPRKKSIWHR